MCVVFDLHTISVLLVWNVWDHGPWKDKCGAPLQTSRRLIGPGSNQRDIVRWTVIRECRLKPAQAATISHQSLALRRAG
jgi:hypothetical protein